MELNRLRPLLESFKRRGLSEADIRVILRGKALEFYSRHYGKVLVSAPGGEETILSIPDALLSINQILDETSNQAVERPPSLVQPLVYQYLRLFGTKVSYNRDDVSKLLRGTAIQFEFNEGDEIVYFGRGRERAKKAKLSAAIWNGAASGAGAYQILVEDSREVGGYFVRWLS